MMLIRKAVLAAMMILSAQTAMSSESMTVCPSIEMLKAFDGDFIQTYPVSFDPNTGMTMSIMQRRDFKDADGMFAGYGNLHFILTGVSENADEDAETKAQALLSDMQLDSDTPYQYRAFKDVMIPVCSYSLPGNDAIKAVVLQLPRFKKPETHIA
ncbi:MAG: hypothetical protein ACO1N3_04275 [Gammaproteobacteria bacterium]